eukprot:1409021-Pyramimonas_sp.AAC.1
MAQNYGLTLNCPRCRGGEAAHSHECRTRMKGELLDEATPQAAARPLPGDAIAAPEMEVDAAA